MHVPVIKVEDLNTAVISDAMAHHSWHLTNGTWSVKALEKDRVQKFKMLNNFKKILRMNQKKQEMLETETEETKEKERDEI